MQMDQFFRPIARRCESGAIGVVLSVTASDGALGIEAIKAEGGITFAQDEITARHHGMPRAAVRTGAVDYVLAPAEIARELARIARHPHVRSPAYHSTEQRPVDNDATGEYVGIL